MDMSSFSINQSKTNKELFKLHQKPLKQLINSSINEEEDLSKRLTCTICDKQLGNTKNLKKHYKLHSNLREYKCDKCDKTYKRSDHLARHQVTHTENPTPFECPHCLRQFSMNYHLKSHLENVHKENPLKFKCDQCSSSFAKKIKLLKHQRKEHKENIPKVKCYYPYCYKTYLTQGKLDEHIKLSHGQISLEDIDKDEQELITEMEKKVKYYRCSYSDCVKTYSTQFNLMMHIKSYHLNEKVYKCERCDKKFKHNSSLKRHLIKCHMNQEKNGIINETGMMSVDNDENENDNHDYQTKGTCREGNNEGENIMSNWCDIHEDFFDFDDDSNIMLNILE